MKKIADYFHVTLDYLFGETTNQSPTTIDAKYLPYLSAFDKAIANKISPQALEKMIDLLLWAKDNHVAE